MGFRVNSYARVWSVKQISDNNTQLRISISRKNKQTDEYEQEFSGYVSCYGSAVALKAARLNEGDRIKLGDCDVTTKYDAEKKVTYTNYKLFSFETEDGGSSSHSASSAPTPEVDDGEIDDSGLPF